MLSRRERKKINEITTRCGTLQLDF